MRVCLCYTNFVTAEPFLIHAHSGQLSDFEFSPFDDALLATSADDAHIKLWKIPQDGLTENLSSPQSDLSGHKKSVDVVVFHPTANNVLASGNLISLHSHILTLYCIALV